MRKTNIVTLKDAYGVIEKIVGPTVHARTYNKEGERQEDIQFGISNFTGVDLNFVAVNAMFKWTVGYDASKGAVKGGFVTYKILKPIHAGGPFQDLPVERDYNKELAEVLKQLDNNSFFVNETTDDQL